MVSVDEWNKFTAYVAGFYGNCSNYHNFGHKKFIPEINEETFSKILYSNPLYNDKNACYKEVLDSYYHLVKKEIFEIGHPYGTINYPEKGGITGYFGRDLT